MRYLGLDLGSRTLGIAVSETGLIASNYKTIRHEEEYDRLLDEVKALVEELKIDTVVLGFPKNMNPNALRKFINDILKNYKFLNECLNHIDQNYKKDYQKQIKPR